MAVIGNSRTLFFVTSPRTPWRFISEIETLGHVLTGKEWNPITQKEFMEVLVQEDFYVGTKTPIDPAFSARDRITRAPKAYGFVKLKPSVELTKAGKALISAKRKDEVLLRQMLKFQLPSVYHTQSKNSATKYWVKPFLELMRLINHFGSLTFDEIKLFGMQLTDYRQFDAVCEQIEQFRRAKTQNKGRYKEFYSDVSHSEIMRLYSKEISGGNTKTRESDDKSLKKFVETKLSNLRDYTDACFRYLRATNYVLISQSGHSLSIAPEKQEAVNYILDTIDRNPCFIDDQEKYETYLYDSTTPTLFTDNIDNLISDIQKYDSSISLDGKSVLELREIEYELIEAAKSQRISDEIKQVKDYEQYDDIIEVFSNIGNKVYYDDPLQFEWNTWRAMTMLDGGDIRANLNFDDFARPLSTAPGNEADIVCDYGDFCVNVEVTLQTGQKQYDNEGEPVARHVGKQVEKTGKPTYCFFIAPTITQATYAHFYVLYHENLLMYGGKSNIIPLQLSTFEKMVADSRKAAYVPEPKHIKALFNKARELRETAENEVEWFEQVNIAALDWLNVT